METKANKILIIYYKCDKLMDEIKSNLIDIQFDIDKRIVWKSCPQIDSQIIPSDEELTQYGCVVVIGNTSIDVINEFNLKVRTLSSITDLKLIFADMRQTFVYLLMDFGPKFSHFTIEEYLKTTENNILDKINQNCNEFEAFSPLESIISGFICGQLMDSSRQSKQLFYYEIDSQIIDYKFKSNVPIVVIGLGSLGFSIVRQLVRIGAKNLILIDNDLVHKYNLRHNLFKECDVGLNKCDVVKEYVINCDKDIEIETYYAKVQQANHQFFEELHLNKAVIVSAVDSTETKRFINKVCLNHSLPFIDVGIDGHLCHIQPIVPHLTESYFSYSDASDPEYPLCVVKSFPQIIEHCVEWSKLKFDKWFNKRPKMANNWVQCLQISRLIFEKIFNQKAKQLLFSLPLDHKNENGEDFWADKRSPKPIDFDLNNGLHKTFIISCAQLIASVNNIEINDNLDIYEAIICLSIPEFVPKRDKIIITDPSVTERTGEIEQDLNECNDILKRQAYSKGDENQLKFIYALSNLRSDMYGIENIDISEINRIYNKIIYCFGFTLSTASAVVSIEAINLLQMNGEYKINSEQKFKNMNHFYNLFDLSANVISCPAQPLRTKLSDLCYYTEWDHWVINESDNMSTLEDVLNELQTRTSGSLCTMIVMDETKSLYLPEFFRHHLKRKKQTMRDIISSFYKSIPLFVILSVSFQSNSEDISGPNVKYVFQNNS